MALGIHMTIEINKSYTNKFLDDEKLMEGSTTFTEDREEAYDEEDDFDIME